VDVEGEGQAGDLDVDAEGERGQEDLAVEVEGEEAGRGPSCERGG
jgi:hypothetical protein